MERPLSVQRWNVPTRPRNCSVDAANGPHKENYGQKGRIIDAAIRYALQRIARFAFLNPVGKQLFGSLRPRPQVLPSCSTLFGGGLQFFSSLAVCEPFWPRDHAHQAHQRAARLQSSHRWTPSCSLSSCFFDAQGLCASVRSHPI